MEQAYINTYNKYPVSNITYESFDGKVIPTPEFDYGVPAFSNLTKLLQSDYLQFVPNYGLIWPNVFDVENTFNLSVVTINGNEIPAYIYKNEELLDHLKVKI